MIGYGADIGKEIARFNDAIQKDCVEWTNQHSRKKKVKTKKKVKKCETWVIPYSKWSPMCKCGRPCHKGTHRYWSKCLKCIHKERDQECFFEYTWEVFVPE